MASLYADYYKVRVSARCEIGGTSLPVSAVNLLFRINSIPEATIKLPVGRNAGGPQFNSISPAMTTITDLEPLTTVRVFATLTSSPAGRAAPSNSSGPGFPDGKEFLVFDGFLKSPMYSRTFDGLSVTIQAMGVTAGLASGTPYAKGFTVTDLDNSKADGISFITSDSDPSVDLCSAFIAENGDFGGDLWGELLEPLLDEIITAPSEVSGRTSREARDAFERINVDNGALPPADVSIIGFGAIDSEMGTKSVLTTVLQTFFDTWSGDETGSGDAWTAMMATLRLFGAKYVSVIEEDAILPITYGLGGSEAWRTIQPDEYSAIDASAVFDARFYSYITQVVLYSSAFQSSQWQTNAPKARQIGHASLPSLDESAGRLLMVSAPAWLIPFAAPAKSSVSPGSAIPDASNPTPITDETKKQQGELEAEFFESHMGDDYANAVLYDAVFAHRKMQILGRVRFDIAPGSLLKIVTPGASFAGEGSNLWAHVETVSILIDSDAAACSTQFDLTNVRTDKEQETILVFPYNTIFGTPWLGGKLSREA